MNEKIKKWLIEWFVNNTGKQKDEIEENLDNSYFEMGYLDSFKFIGFISDIEDEFGIEFDNDQFEDRSFSTISGMAKIIEEALNK